MCQNFILFVSSNGLWSPTYLAFPVMNQVLCTRVLRQSRIFKNCAQFSTKRLTGFPNHRSRETTYASLWLPNENDTYKLGYLLGTDPRPSDVLLLYGQLGVGKTALARGYIHAATYNTSVQVTSPTYLLTNKYVSAQRHSETPIYHMDLWRLEDALSRPIVDFSYVFRDAISLIEWPDRLKTLLPSERLDVILEYPSSETHPSSLSTDDTWGFGSGEPNDISYQSGRFARLVPKGNSWIERLDSFHNQHVQYQSDGQCMLSTTTDRLE